MQPQNNKRKDQLHVLALRINIYLFEAHFALQAAGSGQASLRPTGGYLRLHWEHREHSLWLGLGCLADSRSR